MFGPFSSAACGGDFAIMTTKDNGDDDQFNTKKPGVFMSMGSNAQAQLGDASFKNQWVPQLLNSDAPDLTSVRQECVWSIEVKVKDFSLVICALCDVEGERGH